MRYPDHDTNRLIVLARKLDEKTYSWGKLEQIFKKDRQTIREAFLKYKDMWEFPGLK